MADDVIMWVCPKCGAVKQGWPDDECELCECSVISTGVTLDEWLHWDSEKTEKWNREISYKLAPNATEEDRRRSDEYDAKPSGIFIPKCPTCGRYARALSSIENSIPVALEYGFNSKKAGKSFICDHCGYTW